MSDWDTWVQELAENPEQIEKKPSRNEQRFPCPTCAGTGLYQHTRIHQDKKHCFACRGKGYFKTDPRKLAKQRAQRAVKREQQKLDARAINEETGIVEALTSMASWNSFAASMIEQHNAGKAWSEKQVAAARSMMAKVEESRKERKAQREAEAVQVDLNRIQQLFEDAAASGYKRPIYRAEGVQISLAPAGGANAGALYVKTVEDKSYIGKVQNGKFYGTSNATDAHRAALQAIAEDPLAAAVRYGQKTGTCACCGRQLTNHASIELGIGPICKNKWNL